MGKKQEIMQLHNVLKIARHVVCNMTSQCWIEHSQTKLPLIQRIFNTMCILITRHWTTMMSSNLFLHWEPLSQDCRWAGTESNVIFPNICLRASQTYSIKFLRWDFENWKPAYFKTLITRTVVSITTSQQDRKSENVNSIAGRGKEISFPAWCAGRRWVSLSHLPDRYLEVKRLGPDADSSI
jgi:hypothetical protein